MSVRDPLNWDVLPTLAASEWKWQKATTLVREPVQVHESHCGLLLSVEGAGKETTGKEEAGAAVEKKKVEETRSACLCHVPVDVLAHIFLQLSSFKDMATASRVCRKWKEGMRDALAFREKLSFAGWRADDCTVGQLVEGAWNLLELDISLGRWGSRITDAGLYCISKSKCCPNLTSISLWGVTGITDEGVVQLVKEAHSLEHLNVGGTFITDVSVLAISRYGKHLKDILSFTSVLNVISISAENGEHHGIVARRLRWYGHLFIGRERAAGAWLEHVLNLWGCRHVTESGILALGGSCPKLTSINVWGMNISRKCELQLLVLNPQLQLKPSQVRNHSRNIAAEMV